MGYNDDLKELGKRIKNAREEAKLTQHQLYEMTGISTTQISAYENGNKSIGLQSLAKIAFAVNKTIDELYYGSINNRAVSTAKNVGELVVNCIYALHKEEVVMNMYVEDENSFEYGKKYHKEIRINKFETTLFDLINKLDDLEENKENYPDALSFEKQILAATATYINKVNDKLS